MDEEREGALLAEASGQVVQNPLGVKCGFWVTRWLQKPWQQRMRVMSAFDEGTCRV